MKIFNPTLKGDKIQYWESPEPLDTYSDIDAIQDSYNRRYKLWKESVKTLYVHPSAVEEIENYCRQELKKRASGYFEKDFKNLMETVSLFRIEDRLEIGDFCQDESHNKVNEIVKEKGIYVAGSLKITQPCTCKKTQYFILKPLPSKEEETQDKLWMDLINDKEWFNMKNTTTKTLEYFKGKFTLTRN